MLVAAHRHRWMTCLALCWAAPLWAGAASNTDPFRSLPWEDMQLSEAPRPLPITHAEKALLNAAKSASTSGQRSGDSAQS